MNTTDEIVKKVQAWADAADGLAYRRVSMEAAQAATTELRAAIDALVNERDKAVKRADAMEVIMRREADQANRNRDEASSYRQQRDALIVRAQSAEHELRVELVANHDLRERYEEAVGLLRKCVEDEYVSLFTIEEAAKLFAKHDEREKQ